MSEFETVEKNRGRRGDGTYRRLWCYKCDSEFRTTVHPDTHSTACGNCGESVGVKRAEIAFIGQSKPAQKLQDGPVIGLSRGNAGELRSYIRKLKPVGGVGTKVSGASAAREVTYLPGDEREAVRLFIEENTEYVEEVLSMDGNYNVIQSRWPEGTFRMLVEQWEWGESE